MYLPAKRLRPRVRLLLVAALLLLTALTHAAGNGAAKYLEGIRLTDQNGRQLDLYRDLIADHVAVLHTFYAQCTASCPVVMTTLKSLQTQLGPRMEHEVRVVSITVDPAHDDPAALKAYAGHVGARQGWYFLTGSSDQVNAALQRIGQYTAQADAHMDLLIAGNDRTGLWKKINGLATPAQINTLILGVADDQGH